jgi:hypothetical protein
MLNKLVPSYTLDRYYFWEIKMNLFIGIDISSIKLGLFLALDNIFADITVSTPDLSSAETILNMPKRNPMTSKLIDLNADCMSII